MLLVEDHAALRRFVQLALEPLELQLSEAESLRAAEGWVDRHGVPELLLTDLMLPDGSGLDLVRGLRASGHGPARLPVIVMSAAVQPLERESLSALSVARVLVKPVAVSELLEAVASVLAPALTAGATAASALDPAVEYFGGDRALQDAFRASSLQQLPADIEAGDVALARGDLQTLRRVAHSLKSVLALLGDAQGKSLATHVELSSAAGISAESEWRLLRLRLLELVGCP